MNELIRHIEILLLNHDCVIIPQLGGFVAHYTPAKWQAEEKLYFPPTRTIGFNPLLKLNDGLLVQSYMEAYDTDFPDANRKMERDVRKLMQQLHEESELYLQGIGLLSVDADDSYRFTPARNELVAPEYYGLTSLRLEKLSDRKVPKTISWQEETPRKNVYEIHINRTLLHNLVAAAVAIIAFFFLSTPVENTYVEADNYAMLFPTEVTTGWNKPAAQTADFIVTQSVKQKKETVPAKPKAIRVEKVNPGSGVPQKASEKAVTKRYHIIVGSVTSKAEAEALVNRYAKEGFAGMQVLEGNGRIRICIDSFSDKNAAYNQLNQIKKTTPFKDAWLLRQ